MMGAKMGIVTNREKHLLQVERSLTSQALVKKQTELVDNSRLNGKLVLNIITNMVKLSFLEDSVQILQAYTEAIPHSEEGTFQIQPLSHQYCYRYLEMQRPHLQ